MSKKFKMIAALVVLSLASAPLFFKKEKQFVEIHKFSGSFSIKTSIIKFDSNNVVYVKCIFKNAGVLRNTKDKQGISALVSALLFRRINNFSEVETRRTATVLGIGEIFVNPSGDDFEISFLVLKEKIDDAMKFLSLALTTPTISDGDLEYIREMFPSTLHLDTSSPLELQKEKLLEMLYLGGTYGMNNTGSLQAISGITMDDVKGFIKNTLTRKKLKVIFGGDVSRLDANSYTKTLFKDIDDGSDATATDDVEKLRLLGSLSKEKIEKINKSNMNDIVGVMSGIRLDGLSKKEQAAMKIIMDTLFSNTGDFVKGLRLKNISYDVSATAEKRSLSDAFYLSIYIDRNDLGNYQKYLDEKITEYSKKLNIKDLEKTKERFIMFAKIGFIGMCGIHEKMKIRRLPFDEVDQKTFESVASRMFDKMKMKTVIIGKDV